MTLDQSGMGQSHKVVRMDLPRNLKHRLEALGMTQGTELRVLTGKDRGTLIVKVRGCRLAVGRGITRGIEVS